MIIPILQMLKLSLGSLYHLIKAAQLGDLEAKLCSSSNNVK